MRFDIGSPFLSILGRQQAEFYQCLQKQRTCSLLVDKVKHPFNFAINLYQEFTSPNSNCIDKDVGPVVDEVETLALLGVLRIVLQHNRERRIHRLNLILVINPSPSCRNGVTALYLNLMYCIFFYIGYSASGQSLAQFLSKLNYNSAWFQGFKYQEVAT